MPIKTENVRTKGIHVKLDKVTHANFKAQLAQHGLSMQDAFEEFARQVGSGQATANNMLLRFIKAQVKAELADVGLKPFAHKRSRLPELDSDELYDLINEAGEDGEPT